MSDIIIKAQGLGKKYVISHEGRESYTALRDVITRKLTNIRRERNKATTKEDFWALKDLDFEIRRGEAVGIIGRNGAGKSTLLKILSRITEPTSGRLEINGRIASLLEVGTGFHPELTGRENIFLNGAILGMSRAEIKKKFDEIVDFSGVEKFLDTPVKRYSSGMYVRLAFSVAAHLEPEILVVDEVLAVGDAEFQKKCLGKMEEVSQGEGRTVLFVSHNMTAVKSLCTRGIYLSKGTIVKTGAIEDVLHNYISVGYLSSHAAIDLTNQDIHLQDVTIEDNGVQGNFDIEKDLRFRINLKALTDFDLVNVNLFFNAGEGGLIFATCSTAEKLAKGQYQFDCVIPAYTLNDIQYTIDLMVVRNGSHVVHNCKDVITIQGNEVKREGVWLGKFPGLIRPQNYSWTKTAKENLYR